MFPVSLWSLCTTFFYLGATAFGGIWGATEKIRQELIEKKRWFRDDEVNFMLVAAALVPSPKFLGFGGIVGFRLRGWLGSFLSSFSLLVPGALLVLLAVYLIPPEVLSTTLAPVQRMISIAVVGLLIGQAVRMFQGAKAKGKQKLYGVILMAGVAAAIMYGIPLILVALIGFVLGVIFLKESESGHRHQAADGNNPSHGA